MGTDAISGRVRQLLWEARHGDAGALGVLHELAAEVLGSQTRLRALDPFERRALLDRLAGDFELALGAEPPFHFEGDHPHANTPISIPLADLATPAPVGEEPPRDAAPSLWFEVRWVDEVGQPIDGLAITLHADGEVRQATTDGDGRARFDDCTLSTGWAGLADETAAREQLEQRWAAVRPEPWIEVPEPGTTIQLRRSRPAARVRVSAKELHTIVVQPRVVRARLFGAYFETHKCFLLPTALPSLRFVAGTYERNTGCDLLLVGHTDTAGQPAYNDPLSIERAEAMLAYLRNDIDAWYAWYGDKPEKKRWGRREDILMIEALQDSSSRSPNADPIRWYQETRGLAVDGIAGPTTRKTLIDEYMAADGTTLPGDVSATTHGCGEYFPVEPTADGQAELENRRVEAYFFDGPVLPAPPGRNSKKDSQEYSEWVRRASETWDRWPNSRTVSAIRCATRYTLRRTFPKPSMLDALVSTARIMAERPYVQLVIVGHADPPGDDDTNYRLSLARGEAVRALLVGDVEFFRRRFEEPDPSTTWEWEEIQWMLHGVRVGEAPPYIGAADGFAGPATVEALGVFQLAHPELAATYWPDPDTMQGLVEAYLALLGEVPRPEPERIDVVGGGSWHPPRAFGPRPDPGAQEELPYGADLRRVELFLFEEPPTPGVEEFPTTAAEGTAVYDAWCDAVGDEIAIADPQLWVQAVDEVGIPMPGASIAFAPLEDGGQSGTSVSTAADGCGALMVARGFYLATHGDDATAVELDPDEACGLLLHLSGRVEPPPALVAHERVEY